MSEKIPIIIFKKNLTGKVISVIDINLKSWVNQEIVTEWFDEFGFQIICCHSWRTTKTTAGMGYDGQIWHLNNGWGRSGKIGRLVHIMVIR